MAIVTSYDWKSDTWTHHNGDNPARKAFRDAIEVVAAHAREKLPEAVNGRIDAAVKIVIQGDVELLPDDKAKVGSQTNGTTSYHLVDGTCDCRDFGKSPDHWCKHRIAFGIYKRATALAKEQLKALDIHTSPSPVEPLLTVDAPVESVPEPVTPVIPTVPTAEPVVQSEPTVSQGTPPEMPASANVYIEIAGRKVQFTLRDYDEENLLSRMERLLSRFPMPEQEPEQQTTPTSPAEGFCAVHQVQMKHKQNEKGSWWFHKIPDGWCHGKGK